MKFRKCDGGSKQGSSSLKLVKSPLVLCEWIQIFKVKRGQEAVSPSTNERKEMNRDVPGKEEERTRGTPIL